MFAAGCGSACVLNADTPDLPTAFLARIARELDGGHDRVIIGPADDGGYYILGVTRLHPRLFDDIDWSTERVFGQTLERAAELGLEVVALPMWSDIDDAASLRRFAMGSEAASDGARPFTAPNSSAHLHHALRTTDLGLRLGLAGAERVAAE
jgi:glycosyltransferase A (GT-A) superfamily protein (DUF2064 family)